MFCSCSPTSQKETPAPTPPPRPPPRRTPEAVSEAQRIAAALSGVPYATAATPSTKESSSSMECYDEGTPTAAPREARHAPFRPALPTHHLNDPLSFEEHGVPEDDRRGESVL
tara:strand:- start:108 stop:446 length:339 start_codon:yes stop_codon:yes gene_type:complete